MTGSSITGDGVPLTSWKYSKDFGDFIVNSTAPTKTDPTVTYDQL
ncbi:hypothetical protein [Maioricimonas rarisocia]|nr:hypothetical protein [Maioricimonas rarisocia]